MASGEEGNGAPRVWERLLGWLVPPGQRAAARGDAAEEFAERELRDGPAAAHRWYRRQVLRSVVPGMAYWTRAAGAACTTGWEAERMGTWIQDFELALRTLGRRPGFTLTVLSTLALGIGATTALFGVFRAVFLEPIPLPEPGELVIVMAEGSLGCCGPASGPDYLDWVARNRSFSGLALMNPQTYTLTGGATDPQRVFGAYVTAN
ncbi:MAG: hypothetical protein PVI57_21780, partial [Gemmatimonadota bacterium]